MAKVVTLTPNPALDIAAHVARLVPSEKLRCEAVKRDPGGGGINVARVIHRLGGVVEAVYAAGDGSGDELKDLLAREGLQQTAIPCAGHTRESFNVTEESSGNQFRFILPGDPLDEDEWNRCIDTAVSRTGSGDYLVGSGSLPPGVPSDFYARAARAAKARGARMVIDTQGPALKAVLEEGVEVLKLSGRELAEHLDRSPSKPAEWRDAARGVTRLDQARVVTVTLGDKGAILVTKNEAWQVAVPPVRALTTVGAGDSFLGGLLVKLEQGNSMRDALRFAAAAGTAALLTHGTGLCDPADVEKLYAGLTAHEI